MDNDIKDYLVVCETDGTLFRAGYGVPGDNIDASGRFADRGGLFSVCTGWNREAVSRIAQWVTLSAPAVLDNGTYIYDFGTDEVLSDDPMSFEAKDVLTDILGMFPTLCAVIVREPGVYVYGMNSQAESMLSQRHQRYRVCDISFIPEGWHKCVLTGSEKDCMAARNYAYMQQSFKDEFAEFNYVLDGTSALELMPKDCTRETGLRTLCEEIGIKKANVIAIGGKANDREMLAAAGIKVSVADAPQELRNITDFTVSSCLRGGVAEVLDKFDDIVGNYVQTEFDI